jgi:hypothetical protein
LAFTAETENRALSPMAQKLPPGTRAGARRDELDEMGSL